MQLLRGAENACVCLKTTDLAVQKRSRRVRAARTGLLGVAGSVKSVGTRCGLFRWIRILRRAAAEEQVLLPRVGRYTWTAEYEVAGYRNRGAEREVPISRHQVSISRHQVPRCRNRFLYLGTARDGEAKCSPTLK